MKVEKFDIEDLLLLKPKLFRDSRGFFCERFKSNVLEELGISNRFVQDNFSRSAFKTLRGLHYQFDKPQSKLVTCTRGEILDVAVDIRKNSKTFGKSVALALRGDDPTWFWIPAGFAHGFAVLSEEGADVLYKVDEGYNPHGEGNIVWNDPELDIQWKINEPLLSQRDQGSSSFATYKQRSHF